MVSNRKPRISINISPALKDRFLKCLEIEGIDQTNFIIGKIYEFVCQVEEKEKEKAKRTTDENL